jgi:hypothetical protein
MRLWTVQPVEVWEILKKQGYFICEPEKSDYLSSDWGFKKSYDWLVNQMDMRVGKRPNGVSYPIWAWHTRDWKHKKPDLRNIGLGNKGEKSVCIEIEIPDNEVLLHDYDAWHYVLNNWWYDGSFSERDWEKKHNWFDKLSNEEKEILTKKSWERIFDVSPFKNDWFQKGRYIQATFWVLYLKDVKNVRYFIAR